MSCPFNRMTRWHRQQELILKKWGESSSCLRYMHYKAYQKYKKMSFRFTLPIIIISTITGTANFAQDSFPEDWVDYVPLVIGGFNIFGGILTTILQFMKVNELMEAHRVSSISYGKLYRNIFLELNLPPVNRTHDGMSMLDVCKTEYDRLIEQSPPIPGDIQQDFEVNFPYAEFTKPDIATISPIEPYFESPSKFKRVPVLEEPPAPKPMETFHDPIYVPEASELRLEIEKLSEKKLVSSKTHSDSNVDEDNQND